MSNKTVEQEIERVIRLYLNAQYQDNMEGWKHFTNVTPLDSLGQHGIEDKHIPIALLLRVIDRIDSIEKLLHAQKDHNTDADIQQ